MPSKRRTEEIPELKHRSPAPSPKVELWARNLYNPSHLAWTPEGRLLVTEHSAGQIKDVTEGGDMKDEDPVVDGLEGPAGMVTLEDGRMLVAESWAGRITDVGDGSDATTIVTGLSKPYSLASVRRGGEERIYVTEDRRGLESWITDVTDPDDTEIVFEGFPATAGPPGNVPMARGEHEAPFHVGWEQYAGANCGGGWLTSAPDGRLFASVSRVGTILELPDREDQSYPKLLGGDLAVARGLGHVAGTTVNAEDGLLYATQPRQGGVIAIDPDRTTDYRFTAKLVEGLVEPTSVRFGPRGGGSEMYVCSRGEGTIWRISNYR